MSATYSDLTETNFPDSLDTMTRVSDLNYENKALADQYYAYLNAGDFTSAQSLLSNNSSLQTMIINAAKINKFIDALVAVERFFKNDVEGYLEVTFAYIGEYSSGTTYKKGNIISYSGEGFICRVTTSSGVSPTSHTTNTNWALIAKQGIQGVSGTGLSPRGIWNNSNTYYINDCVAYNNSLWQCLVGNTNSTPSVENTNWLALFSNIPDTTKMFYPNNQYGGIVSSNFDSINTSGFYTGYGTAIGAPNTSSSWFVLHQNSNVGTVTAWQMARSYTNGSVYTRQKNESAWGVWSRINFNITGSGTLASSGWSLSSGIYSQSIVDPNITSDMDTDITITDSSMVNAIFGASKIETYNGGFTVKCTAKPSYNISFTYVSRRIGI